MSTERFSTRLSDRPFLAASRLFVAPDDDTYLIIHIPKYSFVSDVWLDISKAYVGGGTIEIGFAGNGETAVAYYFITSDISEPTVKGIKRSVGDTLLSGGSKYFGDGSGALTVTIAAGLASVEGNFTVFAQYYVIS